MLKKATAGFLAFHLSLASLPLEQGLQKVESSFIIGEPGLALSLSQELSSEYPSSEKAHLALIKALCLCGQEAKAFEVFSSCREPFKESNLERTALEWLGWAVLNKAQDSPMMPIMMNALQGAALTNDSKAIPLFIKQLKSPYAIVRALSIRSASHYGDEIIKEEIRHLLKSEKVWYVKLEAIDAAGRLRMKECLGQLQEIISSPKSLAEEKLQAILAIVQMTDTIDDTQLNLLLKAPRAGLRELGCALIAPFEKWEHIPTLMQKLKDTSSDVRLAALNTLCIAAQLQKLNEMDFKRIWSLTEDPNFTVALTSAYVCFLGGVKEAEAKLENWAFSSSLDQARLTSAAIAASGEKGQLLACKILDKESDLFIRFNLAFGLISHRKEEKKALEILVETLKNTEGSYLMWESTKNPLFRELLPSQLRHIDQISNYPKIIDQIVRLQILNVLSMRKHKEALPAIRNFLKNSDWGVVAEASALLIQEGEEPELELVRALIHDKDEEVRLQAALVLALFGADHISIPILMKDYPLVSREQKIQILLALGHIGDPQAIPFLLSVMQEPFQQLRIIAASCLIQILFH